jgi:hypothetical protein
MSGRNPGCPAILPDDSLRLFRPLTELAALRRVQAKLLLAQFLSSPYGPLYGRSTRFAFLSAALHPGYGV